MTASPDASHQGFGGGKETVRLRRLQQAILLAGFGRSSTKLSGAAAPVKYMKNVNYMRVVSASVSAQSRNAATRARSRLLFG